MVTGRMPVLGKAGKVPAPLPSETPSLQAFYQICIDASTAVKGSLDRDQASFVQRTLTNEIEGEFSW